MSYTDNRAPSRQRYYGPVYARDFIGRNLHHLISSNPATVARMRHMYGRHLSGLGSVDDITGSTDYDPFYQDQEPFEIERDEDTFGSGIFDPAGRAATSNPDMGVFASHYSLPGFIAREVPFTVHRDISDLTADADVITVPGGGMAYVEQRGRLSGAAITGPTWQPPLLEPPGYTNFAQTYARLNGFGEHSSMPRPALNPNAPVTNPAPLRRPARLESYARGVPFQPRPEGRVPFQFGTRPVPKRQIVFRPQIPVPVDAVPDPVTPKAPDLPRYPEVPFTPTFNVGPTRAIAIGPKVQPLMMPKPFFPYAGVGQGPCPEGQIFDLDTDKCVPAADIFKPTNGNGQQPGVDDKKPATPAQLALAGAAVGVAAALLIGATRSK